MNMWFQFFLHIACPVMLYYHVNINKKYLSKCNHEFLSILLKGAQGSSSLIYYYHLYKKQVRPNDVWTCVACSYFSYKKIDIKTLDC